MLLIEELLISPRCLLITVFVVAFLGWLFAVKLYTPSDKFWRVSHFLVLLFTCFGIYGVVQDGRMFLCNREYDRLLDRIESKHESRLLSNLNEYPFCFFADSTIHNSYHITCQWIREKKDYVSDCYKNKQQINIDSLSFPILENADPVLESYFNNLDHCISDYNNDITELREYEKGQSHNVFELIYLLFSPLFIAVGLGWEFVKLLARR